jgi:hypothetical protein
MRAGGELKDFNDGYRHYIVNATPAVRAQLDALPDTIVTRIDDRTVAVKTKATCPELRVKAPAIGRIEDDKLMSLAADPVSNDPHAYLQWSLQNLRRPLARAAR